MKPQENKATTDTEESGNRTPMILLSRDEQNNQVRVVVGNSPELLEDKSNRVVAVTDEGGHPRAQGDEGIAIAGYNGTAEGGKAGLAYVKSGTATSGHNAIAVTRGHGTAPLLHSHGQEVVNLRKSWCSREFLQCLGC